MGLSPDDIATIVPPENPAFLSDRTSFAFNDASAMPGKQQGLSPVEISAAGSELAAVPLTEHEQTAKPHKLLCVMRLRVPPPLRLLLTHAAGTATLTCSSCSACTASSTIV